MKIYTGKGDDGSTGLFYGGRTSKADTGPEAYGAVDEAVSALGVARSRAESADVAEAILAVQRELFVVAAELATSAENRSKLTPGETLVTAEMIAGLETAIDRVTGESGLPTEFVVPGGSEIAAHLDVARTVVRRAERRAVAHHHAVAVSGSLVVPYLNRLADYLYVLARSVEADWEPSKEK